MPAIPVILASRVTYTGGDIALTRRLLSEMGQGPDPDKIMPFGLYQIGNADTETAVIQAALYNVRPGDDDFTFLVNLRNGTYPDLSEFSDGTTQAEIDAAFGALIIRNPTVSGGVPDLTYDDGGTTRTYRNGAAWALAEIESLGYARTFTPPPAPTQWAVTQAELLENAPWLAGGAALTAAGGSATNPQLIAQRLAVLENLFPDGDWS